MTGEKIVHIIDLHYCEPAQWIDLLLTLKKRKEEVLDQMSFYLTTEAEKLDFPLQSVLLSTVEDLDIESLPVRTSEAVAISSVLQLHCLLATDDEMVGRNSPAASMNLQRAVHMSQRTWTFAEWLERDMINAYISSPDSALSPPSLCPFKMEIFLNNLRKFQPKLMLITEQESNLDGSNLMERIEKALHFYSALFDCLDSTVKRSSLERKKLESMLLGEQTRNIIACDGDDRKERHEKLEMKWIPWLEMVGFVRVPLSNNGELHAKKLLQSYGNKYKIREENDCLLVCWSDRPLFSVSAWSIRR